MLHHALVTPHDYIGLFYSARTPDEFAYDDEWHRLARDGRIDLRQTITRSIGEAWSGPRGRIDRAQLESLLQESATLCFVCGPPTFVAETARLLAEARYPTLEDQDRGMDLTAESGSPPRRHEAGIRSATTCP